MEKTVSSLAESLVTKDLEEVLAGYPNYPYRQVFANPDLRRSLIDRVLSQLPSQDAAFEKEQSLSINSNGFPLLQEQHVSIKNLIRQEISYMVQQKAECISRSSPKDVESCFTPSHWFG